MKLLSQVGYRVFRNNVGSCWIGKSSRLPDGRVIIDNPRRFHAGLCEGSSDLIGWKPVKITEDMVGETVAVFTAFEIKTPKGRVRDSQKNFISQVKNHGGIAEILRSVDDIEQLSSTDPEAS